MVQIVDQIKRAREVVGQISRASLEQKNGVAEVGQAIGPLEQSTQENAALMAQTAAAAQSLEHQARSLVAAVTVFKVCKEYSAAQFVDDLQLELAPRSLGKPQALQHKSAA